jgi:hypothetical protein
MPQYKYFPINSLSAFRVAIFQQVSCLKFCVPFMFANFSSAFRNFLNFINIINKISSVQRPLFQLRSSNYKEISPVVCP